MAKYFYGPDFAAAVIMGPGCGDLSSGHINDTVGMACWKVSGAPVIIGSGWMPVQAGFELCNFNYRVHSSVAAVPVKLDLPGVVA